jgi:hypothetical protein
VSIAESEVENWKECTHTHTFTHTCAYTHARPCTITSVQVRTRAYTHTHTCVRAHLHTHGRNSKTQRGTCLQAEFDVLGEKVIQLLPGEITVYGSLYALVRSYMYVMVAFFRQAGEQQRDHSIKDVITLEEWYHLVQCCEQDVKAIET